MCDAAAQAEFMERNCFYCEKLRARITYRQCELNRAKPRISEARPEKSVFGYTTNKPVDYMPFKCEGCPGPGKEEPMKAGKSGYPEGTCEKCGEHKRIMGRGLCGKCYMAMRTEQKKAGTWNPTPQVGLSQPKPETRGPDPEPAQKAIPQAEAPSVETKGSEPKQAPLPGDLYLVARIPLEQIRVMTEEQLREMFGG